MATQWRLPNPTRLFIHRSMTKDQSISSDHFLSRDFFPSTDATGMCTL